MADSATPPTVVGDLNTGNESPPPVVADLKTGKEWDALWQMGIRPGEYWDKESPVPVLVEEVAAGWMPAGSGLALIPGCGRGYDVELLAKSDRFSRVIGMDISETAVKEAKTYLEGRNLDAARWDVQCADFFDFPVEEKMQFVLDYTFLCALPVEWRPKWAARMKELVAVGGSLVTVIFPIDKPEPGPPHDVTLELFEELLEGKGFKAVDGPRMLDDSQCHSDRQGQTGYARWLRVE